MSILGVLGAIGTGLGVLGNGITLFGGKGDAVANMGTQLTNSAGTLSAIKGAEEQSALSREVYDYQKSLQERIFQREDNAVQRRALDLEKAGLSKTLAAGNGANAGQAIKVDTPQSESALRGQALSQGVQNMLSIAQAKANIALTEANAKKAESEANINEYDLNWFDSAGLPTGAKSGLVFFLNSIATNLGISNKQAVSVLSNVVVRIAKKFGIDLSEAASWFGDTVNESSSSINAVVSSAGKSVSVGISNHLGITSDPLLGVSNSEAINEVENKVYTWADKYLEKRKLKKLLKETSKYSEGRIVSTSSGGGLAW